MQDEESQKAVNFIKKQFLQNVPVREICWKRLNDIDCDLQEQIINKTTQSANVLKYPVNIQYQKTFLKHLIQELEKQNSAIHDSLYEEYGRLVSLPCESNAYFKHYSIENSPDIVLKEDIRLISEGTTGLRTWEASLVLSEWILFNPSVFENKTILELGSGIGLTGIVLASHCSIKSLYLTDCHSSVLQTLCDNIRINLLDHKDCKESNKIEESWLLKERFNSCTITVLNLPWEEVSSNYCRKLGHIDVIVAADIVYDRSIFAPLVNAVDNLFKYCNVNQFILACTERNSQTLQDFLALLRNKRYQIETIKNPPQENFIWAIEPPVKLFTLTQHKL